MKQKKIYLFLIILIGIFFRFNNLNWDPNFHLHPDERFLTMVGNAMHVPKSFNDYLDPKVSTFNPSNIGFNFFVYGTFPLVFNKLIALVLNNNSYNAFTIQGRFLSAFFDLLAVFFVYKTARLLLVNLKSKRTKKTFENLPLWSAFFYSIAVLPIQLAHFFTVDSFLNFFMLASFYFSLKFYYGFAEYSKDELIKWKDLVLSGVFFGFALASKVTGLFILFLNLVFILLAVVKRYQLSIKTIFKYLIIVLVGYFLIAYLFLRLADPYIFQTGNFFDLRLNNLFVANIKTLKGLIVKDINNWYPPMVQWLNKNSVVHSIINNFIFGMGIAMSMLFLGGLILVLRGLKLTIRKGKFLFKIEDFPLLIILFWVIVFFVYQSLQPTPTLRYFIFIYPFLAIFAAIGMEKATYYLLLLLRKVFPKNKQARLATNYFLLTTILITWPLMFSSIYLNKNSRVRASEWIYKNLASGSFILGEHWDDPLPLVVGKTYGKRFQGDSLHVFDPDSKEKFTKINQLLKKGDYYILSSNRGWGSIPTVPEKYPKMSRFYNQLLRGRCPIETDSIRHSKLDSGEICYKKIKEFTSYPSLKYLGIPIEFPDQWADESFTVYDHPKVMIFKNEAKEK